MFVTDSLTIGQLTFILRVILQFLSLAGPPLIGLLILSNASRLGSLSTHDLVNRITGALNVNKSSAIWIWNYFRGNTQDPVRSFRLPVGITLLLLYGLFSSLSDIGFLGLQTCSIPAPVETKVDFPASIGGKDAAQSAVLSSFVNGTDLSRVKAYRCDSSANVTLEENISKIVCTAWHNSTWADPNLFTGINTTDSDALIPRKVSGVDGGNQTTFLTDTEAYRVEVPTIQGGILVNPHEYGVQAIFGIPQLDRNQTVTLDKVMALEVEVGCMSLGIGSTQLEDSLLAFGIDVFRTNGTWRKYSGPDNLYDILSNITDSIREYWRPIFNTSTLDVNGTMTTENSTTLVYTHSVTPVDIRLPYFEDYGESSTRLSWFNGNCTNLIRQEFGLPEYRNTLDGSWACGILGLSGSTEFIGQLYSAQNNYVCASTSQLNMVSATVRHDAEGSISLDSLTRLPSDLNSLIAEYWEIRPFRNDTAYWTFEPYMRYTLSDNKDGPTSHYIVQEEVSETLIRNEGLASGGYALSRAGTRAILTGSDLKPAWSSIEEMDFEGDEANHILDPKTLTRWGGQTAASFIVGSLQYNGWAALDQRPILIKAQGSQLAICYNPIYALGFLPLVLAAMLVGSWFFGIMVGTSVALRHLKHLGELYGGMYPYWRFVCPDLGIEDIFLIWRKQPNARLVVVSSNHGNQEDVPRAVDYLASTSESEQEQSDLVFEKQSHDQTP